MAFHMIVLPHLSVNIISLNNKASLTQSPSSSSSSPSSSPGLKCGRAQALSAQHLPLSPPREHAEAAEAQNKEGEGGFGLGCKDCSTQLALTHDCVWPIMFTGAFINQWLSQPDPLTKSLKLTGKLFFL